MATDFLQFNPAQINQETDGQYAADSQRTGGLGNSAIVPSVLLNKVLYDLSTFVAAFGQMLNAKGYPNSSSDISVLQAVLANLLTEADQLPQLQAVPYSPTPVFNAGITDGFQMSLVGNVNSFTINGVTPGQLLAFYFLQDGVGGRTVGYPGIFTGAIQPDPSPNVMSIQLFRVDLGGQPRAVTPVISSNGVFFNSIRATALTASTLALSPAAAIGATLIAAAGGSLVPRSLTAAEVTGARQYGTVYQNTSGAVMTCCVIGSAGSGGGSMTALIGTQNPPSLVVTTQARVPASSSDPVEGVAMTFLAPPGWFYTVANYNLSLTNWLEYTYQ
jgi:hypothetical protein